MATCRLDLPGKRKKCCDPYKLHENPVTKGLRNISEKVRSSHHSLHFESDDQLCTSCRKRVAARPEGPEEVWMVESSQSEQSEAEAVDKAHAREDILRTSAGTDALFISPDHEISVLNASLSILGESPIIKKETGYKSALCQRKSAKNRAYSKEKDRVRYRLFRI